jgi:type II secretory pathway component PulL
VKGLLGRAARGAGKQVQKVIPPCCKLVMIVSGAVAVLSCVGWLVSRKKIA